MKALFLVSIMVIMRQATPQCVSINDNKFVPRMPDLRAITPFSVSLLREVLPPKGNFFFSPYSIWTALTLTYLGSGGTTEAQLRQALQLRNKENSLAMYKYLDELYSLKAGNPDYTLIAANKIFIQENIPLMNCLRNTLPKELRTINFQQSVVAADTINQFVSDITRRKITQLVQPGDIARAQMAIVNAVYFKGLWDQPFNPANTRREKFFTSPHQYHDVNMMNLRGFFKTGFSNELDAHVLEMPYKGRTASMFVFLPSGGKGEQELYNMVRRLTPITLLSALPPGRPKEIDLAFPKFRLETVIREDLLQALSRLGMTDLFTSAGDLTTFFPSGGPGVDRAVHKAVLEVDEKGAEAAAATGVAFPPMLNQNATFRCDKPFAFIIYDNEANNVLFMGVFRQP